MGWLRRLTRKQATPSTGTPAQATPEQRARILPMGYAFPEELFVEQLPEKRVVWAEVVPGLPETYRFGASDQAAYLAQYQEARFAFTWKKGGWDCLRHYEILASGSLPVFRDLRDCPDQTLVAFPKAAVLEAMDELLPWRPGHEARYDHHMRGLLAHAREHLGCGALARRFLDAMGLAPDARILVLAGNRGVNYSREALLIGLKRMTVCEEWPRLPFLYDSFPESELSSCIGMGYGYARLLPAPTEAWTEARIRESIRAGAWDAVVYGKFGADEGSKGRIPTCPFWNDVQAHYGPDQIAFLFGGDAIQDLGDADSAHTQLLLQAAQHGRCFVRELA